MPTALVTGGSRGLGRALAEALVRRGWQTIITGRDGGDLQATAAELRRLGPVIAFAGDVADPVHRRALAGVAARAGGLSLLVHNASTLGASPLPRLDQAPQAVLTRAYEVNVLAPIALTQAVDDHLLPGATVLAITSDAAVEPYPGWGVYGPSKAALDHTFAIWAQERPDRRWLVVDPGDMRTRMHQEAFPGEDITDRPVPESRVPALLALLDGDQPSARYRLADLLVGAER